MNRQNNLVLPLWVGAALFVTPAQLFAEPPAPCSSDTPLPYRVPADVWNLIFKAAGKGTAASAALASKKLNQLAMNYISKEGLDLSRDSVGNISLTEENLKVVSQLFPRLEKLSLRGQSNLDLGLL